MPETSRDRSLFLVAVSGIGQLDDAGGERLCEGDIRALSRARPGMHVGTGDAQRCEVLWLYLETMGEIGLDQLTEPLEQGGVIYDKRRYCIPLARLEAHAPSLDLIRVRDPADCYQPFVGGIDEDVPESYRYDEVGPLLDSEGVPFVEKAATLAVLEDQIITKRLGRRSRLDLQKLNARQVFRLSDGSFVLSVTSTCGYFMDETPRHVFPVGGLVLDKTTRRYL